MTARVPAGRRRRGLAGLLAPLATFAPRAAVAVLVAAVSGCATAPPAAEDTALPWEVPGSAFPTQRLYRVSYDGPEGEGSFKLTLRLAVPVRYQAMAADPLGRPLWSLDAGYAEASRRPDRPGDGALWIDHRNRVVCRLEGRLELAHLTPFPLGSLPALLLGRLPSPPAPGELPAGADAGGPLPETLSYRDADGRTWTATLAGGQPRAWSMREPGEEMAAVTWSGAGAEAVLSDRGRGVQVRWREVVSEPLGGIELLAVPEGYRPADCAEIYRRD